MDDSGDADGFTVSASSSRQALRVRISTHPARNEEHLRISAGVFDVHNVRVPAGLSAGGASHQAASG